MPQLSDPVVTTAAASPTPISAEGAGDLAFDSFFSAAIGGSAIALYFLVVDAFSGTPLFTPSLIGTVLFTGAVAEAVTEVSVEMVAYFTIVHFVSFATLGVGLSVLCRSRYSIVRRRTAMTAALWAVLTGGCFLAAFTVMPGIVGVIGVLQVVLANLVTSVAMTQFLAWSHADNQAA